LNDTPQRAWLSAERRFYQEKVENIVNMVYTVSQILFDRFPLTQSQTRSAPSKNALK
jgi:hypothetical protein